MLQVTDYTRDLDEMQNVSREDYLASLRRYACYLEFIFQTETICGLHWILFAERVVVSQGEYLNTVAFPGNFL